MQISRNDCRCREILAFYRMNKQYVEHLVGRTWLVEPGRSNLVGPTWLVQPGRSNLVGRTWLVRARGTQSCARDVHRLSAFAARVAPSLSNQVRPTRFDRPGSTNQVRPTKTCACVSGTTLVKVQRTIEKTRVCNCRMRG